MLSRIYLLIADILNIIKYIFNNLHVFSIYNYENYCKNQFENLTFSQMTFREIPWLNSISSLYTNSGSDRP